MIGCIKRSVQTGRKADIIYCSKSGFFSKRTIRIFAYADEHIIAFCHMRNEIRTFKLKNILAMEMSEQKMEAYA